MHRFITSLGAALFAGSCALLLTGAAHALCAVPTAGFGGGLFGASAVTAEGCFVGVDQNGGAGSTNASAASTDSTAGVTLTALANLTTGVLTAYAPEGIASASLWDTLTFSGLPADGAPIVATLSLAGSLTGGSFLIANLEAGTPADFAAGFPLISASFPGSGAASLPTSISVTFEATNGLSETVFADILAHGVGGVADFSDPPTLSVTLPAGVDVTTAGGFDNFAAASGVPEPSTWALLLLGFAGFGLRKARLVGLVWPMAAGPPKFRNLGGRRLRLSCQAFRQVGVKKRLGFVKLFQIFPWRYRGISRA